jgi:hypothetical protein
MNQINNDYDDEYDDDERIGSLEETKKQWDKEHKRSDDMSAKLGEKMLEGWTLLGSLCPGIY